MITFESKEHFMIALSLQQRVCVNRRDPTEGDSNILRLVNLTDTVYMESFKDMKMSIWGVIPAHLNANFPNILNGTWIPPLPFTYLVEKDNQAINKNVSNNSFFFFFFNIVSE